MDPANSEYASLAEQKAAIRKSVRKRSQSVSLSDKFRLDRQILLRLLNLPEFGSVRSVHLYLSSFRWEVSTIHLVERIRKNGGTVMIPMAVPENYDLRHAGITGEERFIRGTHNVWEPLFISAEECDPDSADVIIVPGVAFDRGRNRIGSGAGYYDRFLARAAKPKISLAYGYQVFNGVPAADFDQKVDILITEDEVIR